MLTREQALENLGAEEVAHRQEAERLWLAYEQSWVPYLNAYKARPDGESEEERDAHPDVAPLKAVNDAAYEAWDNFPCDGIETAGPAEPRRCALTNCVLFEGDDVFEHSESDTLILTAALGLPDDVLTAVGDEIPANDAGDSEAA